MKGNTLALITHNSEMQHFLELYDVKQGVQSLVQIKLDPHVQTQKTLKIGDMAFSPDGIYLALGRRDNRIQIYDSRYLTKDPVLNLAHGDRVSIAYDLKNGQEDGITKVEWIQEHTGHVGLVTGGADGKLI